MLDGASQFSVRDCTCAVEADRPFVYRNITALMVACGAASEEDEDEALDCFDKHVRSEVLRCLQSCFGSSAFSYRKLLVVAFFLVGTRSVDEVAAWGCGAVSGRQLLGYTLNCLFLTSCVYMNWMVFTSALLSSNLQLKGWHNTAWVGASWALVTVPLYGLSQVGRRLRGSVDEGSDAAVVALVSLLVLGSSGPVLLRICPCRCRSRSEMETESVPQEESQSTIVEEDAESQSTIVEEETESAPQAESRPPALIVGEDVPEDQSCRSF